MSKQIQLTQGKVALVDDEDFQRISKMKWCFDTGNGYAVRGFRQAGRVRKISMHREVMNIPPNCEIDNINGDKLDNRHSNLRIADHAKNSYNRPLQKNNKSGVIGVYWHTRRQRWIAQIKVNGKMKILGQFTALESAALAYDNACKEIRGEFARTNSEQD